jgi:hypothetical protein
MILSRWKSVAVAAAVSLMGAVEALEAAPEPRRGDVDEDGAVTITDAINLLGFLFLSGPAPPCDPVADASDDGEVNITDPVRILNFLFLGEVDLPSLTAAELEECGADSEPPVFPPRSVYRAFPGNLVEFALGAVDPEGDSLHYESNDLPAGATLDPGTGVFRWTPGVEHVGGVTVRCSVTDEGRPPNLVETDIVFDVLAPEPCVLPRCDPALGCDPVPIDDLGTACCGDPGARVPDPDVPCPEGAVLHVGRNSATSTTIGRLVNCDGLRVGPLAQGGEGLHLNLEARCVDASFLVTIRVRLETATAVLVNESTERFLTQRPDGYYQARSMGLFVESEFAEGTEAHLTLTLKDTSGKELTRRVRVVLTREPLENLP